MAYSVELTAEVDRELDKLDPQHSKRILKFLYERVAKLDDPRSVGEALHGSRLGEFWKYRVGDYRLICEIEDDSLVVLGSSPLDIAKSTSQGRICENSFQKMGLVQHDNKPYIDCGEFGVANANERKDPDEQWR